MLTKAQSDSRRLFIDISHDMIDASTVAYLEGLRGVICEAMRDGRLSPVEVRKVLYLLDRQVDVEMEGKSNE